MRNYIKEGWNKIPRGGKSAIKIVAGLAVVAVGIGAARIAYAEHQQKNDELVLGNDGTVLEDVAVVVTDDPQEVIVTD